MKIMKITAYGNKNKTKKDIKTASILLLFLFLFFCFIERPRHLQRGLGTYREARAPTERPGHLQGEAWAPTGRGLGTYRERPGHIQGGLGTYREAWAATSLCETEVEKAWAQATHREAEVERLGHPKLARPDVVEVPGDDEVDGGVDEQHDHGVQQSEVVVDGGRPVEVAPSGSLTWRHTGTGEDAQFIRTRRDRRRCSDYKDTQGHEKMLGL